MSTDDKNVKEVYEQIKEYVDGDRITSATLISLVTHLIPITQKVIIDKHKGPYKKKVVITVLKMIIDDSKLNDSNKETLHLVVQSTIPFTIDTMVGIAKGDIDLAKYKESVEKCCIIL